MSKEKYIILQGIEHGNKFFTPNHENATKLSTGEVAYKILGYANSIEEAQSKLYPTKEDRNLAIRKHLEETNRVSGDFLNVENLMKLITE